MNTIFQFPNHWRLIEIDRNAFFYFEAFIPTRVVGIVGIGHSAGISKLWGTVKDTDIPPLLVLVHF